jgi:hypothetical protein
MAASSCSDFDRIQRAGLKAKHRNAGLRKPFRVNTVTGTPESADEQQGCGEARASRDAALSGIE